MNEENLNNLFKRGKLRKREPDLERVKSMIELSKKNVSYIKTLAITEDSCDLIFREIYESIRQLGDAGWWLLGYEPRTHDISLDILKNLDIKHKTKLLSLDRLKKIRHDLNYRGIGTTIQQAKEILEFWDACGADIFRLLNKTIILKQSNRV